MVTSLLIKHEWETSDHFLLGCLGVNEVLAGGSFGAGRNAADGSRNPTSIEEHERARNENFVSSITETAVSPSNPMMTWLYLPPAVPDVVFRGEAHM